jgi:hypothetical protein
VAYFPTRAVDDGRSALNAHDRVRSFRASTENGLNACQQLAGRKRLDDIIISTGAQSANAIFLRTSSGQNDDR